MIFKHKKHATPACISAACFALLSIFSGLPQSAQNVSAAQTEWHFDFGGNGAANGYTAVEAGTSYSNSSGYGFANTSQVKNVAAAGKNELSDAVQFTNTSDSNTFNVDLPNGFYEIKVRLGNTTRASVKAENVLQLINMTGNNSADSFRIPVTDGQLNLMVTEGKANTAFTLSALDITKLSDSEAQKQTIWVCGDSTVCNYYPLESSTQAGWAQMLGKYVDTTKFDIRNMAASGQYAKGFVDAGQFAPIETYGKPGDYYIISIGINDTNYSNGTEYEQVITDMTQKAKAKGMTVILVKQQGRANDISRDKLLAGRWFGDILDKIGTAENVQVVDLFTSSQNYWLSIGQDAVYNLFMDGDTLHPNRAGADKLAELVANEITFEVSSGQTQSQGTTSTSSTQYAEKNISAAPTIYMIGDSTMCNYKASDYPQTGWGQVLGNYFADKVTIDNRARAGRSSKMFINEGTWDGVYNQLKPGDYVFISFGINDGNYNNADRYAPVSDGTFQKCMSTFVEGALEKGATPVLFTTVLGLASYQNGKFASSYTEYGQATKEIAAKYGVPCIDINSLMVDHYNSVGYDTVYTYHMISAVEGGTDKTHFTEKGATVIAELAAKAIAGTNLYLGTLSAYADSSSTSTTTLRGDVNADGQFNVSDVVLLQKWLLAVPNTHLADWKAADLCEDDRLDVFDLCMMKSALLTENGRYLAINAAVNGGVSETTNAGSSTGTYINLDNSVGSSISWTVNVPENGNYELTFRTANGGTAARPMALTISGSTDTRTINFPTSSSWTNWTDTSIVVPLNAGQQTITLTSTTADGGPNMDYMTMKKTSQSVQPPDAVPEPDKSGKQVEALDRGLVVANTGNGMLLSWRSLATDNANTTFKLYKNGTLLADISADKATNYLDKSGKATDKYTIEAYSNSGKIGSTENAIIFGNKNGGQSGAYFDIPLDVPAAMTMPDGSTCTYSPNDASVGDADGDGEYEIFLKWDPSNAQDNSKDGYTGNVYIDCYKLNGTKLWRIDLGKNIRAGAHYTQFMVYDYDGDGIAELVCKTADGTVDGTGKVIGDGSKDYRSTAGRILTGPEYLTLFDGKTGKALDTVDYKPARGTVSNWGDDYGNRVDRFLAATAYLDGQTPSVIMGRGYYTRMAVTAYDVVNKKLKERWAFDTGHDSSVAGYGDGNHNCMPADVDGDGKQELVMGSAVIDDNGKLLYTSGLSHGDAMHVGDFDPSNPGIEIFMCHEEKSAGYGISLRDGKTGKMIYREKGEGDTGRCIADNLIPGNNSAELVGSHNGVVYDTSGNTVCNWSDITKWGQNSVIYWTDTLERAVMDRNMIDQYGKGRVFTGDAATANNSSKSNAVISCDLLGDWREEVIFQTNNGTALRVFTTTFATDYKIYTLMHNPQYRAQVAGQNVAYNQPPHTDYFIGTGFELPDVPEVYAAE